MKLNDKIRGKSATQLVATVLLLFAVCGIASATPDLIVTDIVGYHNASTCPPWFNLSNEVNVTVKNNGTTPAGVSSVALYIDSAFFGKKPVGGLAAGASETVTFEGWVPVGDDCLQEPCVFDWSYHDYNLTAIADCDGEVEESNESNNATSVVERACYNGYMADEPLTNVAHSLLHGRVLFTTGDGTYGGLYSPGAERATSYDLTLPAGAVVTFAQLNVYYTWSLPEHSCPQMEVRLTNGTGTFVLPLENAYNDIKCTCPGSGNVKAFGNYVYNLTSYLAGSGTYTVTVKNEGSSGHSFCIAAPGLLVVYENERAPLIEYWLSTGADLLLGGRREPLESNLAWWECITNASFSASSETTRTPQGATLGVVSPWAGSSWEPGYTNYLFFNDVQLGTGVYQGYSNPVNQTVDSVTMYVGASDAQVGVNVTNVTGMYQHGSANRAGQADDGDSMMPANALLVVQYGLCGDVDNSGTVDIGDVQKTFNALGGTPVSNPWAADVDCSGTVDIGDVQKIFNSLGGSSLSCCT